MRSPMKKYAASKADRTERTGGVDFRKWAAHPAVGQVLSVVFGLLFLFQCMLLPLVGKAAMGGSGSPGAGPAEHAARNVAFFSAMLLATLSAGAAAFVSKWMRRRIDGGPFPKATAGLLALTLALLAAFAAGLLKI